MAHEGNRRNRGGGRGEGGDRDLASRTVMIETKRFYLDVKENSRGRFIKIAEVSADGRRNQILMTMPTAVQFQRHLTAMIKANDRLGPVDWNRVAEGELESEFMYSDDKKYHVDLKENTRGRFLKVSETFISGASRFQVFIPAHGMEDFNDHLKSLIDEFDDSSNGGEDEGEDAEWSGKGANGGPPTRKFKIGDRNYALSCTRKGQDGPKTITVTEMKGNNKIQIPEQGWDSFMEVFEEFSRQCYEEED